MTERTVLSVTRLFATHVAIAHRNKFTQIASVRTRYQNLSNFKNLGAAWNDLGRSIAHPAHKQGFQNDWLKCCDFFTRGHRSMIFVTLLPVGRFLGSTQITFWNTKVVVVVHKRINVSAIFPDDLIIPHPCKCYFCTDDFLSALDVADVDHICLIFFSALANRQDTPAQGNGKGL